MSVGTSFDTKHLRIKQALTLALATTWLICDVNLRFLSIITPRFLNSWALVIAMLFKCKLEHSLTAWICMAAHLDVDIFSCLVLDQAYKTFRRFCICVMSSFTHNVVCNLTSFAYSLQVQRSPQSKSPTSLISNKNNRGPITLLWTTPLARLIMSDSEAPTRVCCVRLLRKLSIHWIKLPVMPYADSLIKSFLRLTQSTMDCLFFMAYVQSFSVSNRLVLVDWPERKPCWCLERTFCEPR